MTRIQALHQLNVLTLYIAGCPRKTQEFGHLILDLILDLLEVYLTEHAT